MAAKKNKVGNVPNLRFPGFELGWQRKKLGDMADFKAGYAFKSVDMLSKKSNYQLLKMSNVYQSELRLDRNPSYWAIINDKQKEFLLKKGDSILTLTGTFGKRDFGYSVIIKEDDKYLLNQRLLALRERKGISVNGFINQILSNEHFLFHFFGEAKGGTGNQTNVGTEDVKNIIVYFPDYQEQTKIATFLTLIEERIQTQSKIIQRLETLMQNLRASLFTQKIRFKDNFGKSFAPWKTKKLRDIATRITEKNKEDNKNVLTISAQHGLISQLDFFNKSVSAKDITGYFLLKKNDFAYNKSYSNGYPMGAIKRLKYYEKGVVSTLYICLGFNSDIDLDFMEHLLETGIQNSELEKIAQEGARNHGLLNIGLADFFNIKLNIPSLEEQNYIGNFLYQLKEKIMLEKQLLLKYENQKKYFLQKLFI